MPTCPSCSTSVSVYLSNTCLLCGEKYCNKCGFYKHYAENPLSTNTEHKQKTMPPCRKVPPYYKQLPHKQKLCLKCGVSGGKVFYPIADPEAISLFHEEIVKKHQYIIIYHNHDLFFSAIHLLNDWIKSNAYRSNGIPSDDIVFFWEEFNNDKVVNYADPVFNYFDYVDNLVKKIGVSYKKNKQEMYGMGCKRTWDLGSVDSDIKNLIAAYMEEGLVNDTQIDDNGLLDATNRNYLNTREFLNLAKQHQIINIYGFEDYTSFFCGGSEYIKYENEIRKHSTQGTKHPVETLHNKEYQAALAYKERWIDNIRVKNHQAILAKQKENYLLTEEYSDNKLKQIGQKILDSKPTSRIELAFAQNLVNLKRDYVLRGSLKVNGAIAENILTHIKNLRLKQQSLKNKKIFILIGRSHGFSHPTHHKLCTSLTTCIKNKIDFYNGGSVVAINHSCYNKTDKIHIEKLDESAKKGNHMRYFDVDYNVFYSGILPTDEEAYKSIIPSWSNSQRIKPYD